MERNAKQAKQNRRCIDITVKRVYGMKSSVYTMIQSYAISVEGNKNQLKMQILIILEIYLFCERTRSRIGQQHNNFRSSSQKLMVETALFRHTNYWTMARSMCVYRVWNEFVFFLFPLNYDAIFFNFFNFF